MIGKIISDHKIIAELGKGGMGVIYKAEQVSLSRPVAMKVLADHLARDPSFVQRFLNEARAIAKLNHPNIVQIYNVGQEGQIYYFTMEFVDGTPLDEIISQRGILPLERALSIISNVAKALAFAHEHGIIHRDIKPSNIMINKQGMVKLMDFGIALQERARRVTVDGGILGTPEYMSPEQALGQTATSSSDIYSLGVVFYEMLTGRVPIEGDTPLETINRIQVQTPLPPRSINPEIPPYAEKIIMKMMAKTPQERYPTCKAIRQDLKRFRTGGTVQIRPEHKPPPAKPAAKGKALPPRIVPARRRGLKIVVFALSILFLVMAGAFLLSYAKRPPGSIETVKPEETVEPAPSIGASDAETARLAMEQAKMMADTALAQALIESINMQEDHPWIESAKIEDETVLISGKIKRGRRGRVLRHVQRLQSQLEEHFSSVSIPKQEFAADGMLLHVELQNISDFVAYFISRPAIKASLACARIWHMAEEESRKGDASLHQSEYSSAEKSYKDANELYFKASEIAELEKSAASLNHELMAAQSEAEHFRFSDTLVLKKGKEIKGEIISKDDDSIQIRTPLGLVTFPTTQISSLIQAPPEVSDVLRKIRSEMDELEKKKNEFRSMIRELQGGTVKEPIEHTPGEIRQEILSAGTFYAAGFVVLLLILLLLGLSLRPTKEVMIILIFLLALGALDWFNVLNRCESPFYDEECLDYPYEHHVEVFPGLFPPLLFDEGCVESHQKVVKPFGWKCLPITWQVDEWSFCRAQCSVNRISWVCTAAYWYVLACIIEFIPRRLRRKEITF